MNRSFSSIKKRFVLKAAVISMGVISTVLPLTSVTQDAFAATGGKNADQAISWVKSKLGKGIDFDGAYGNQCVDLIKAYYSYLGQKQSYGNGSGYTSNSMPSGWTRIKGAQPKRGDVLVYTGGYGGYGHVAIYESDYSHYHQNWNGHSYVERVTCKYNGSSSINYWGVIRPDFTGSSSGIAASNTVAVTGISLNKKSASLTPGESITLTASVAPSNASNKKYTWSSSNTKVASVASDGKVTGISSGTATITAKTADGSKTASATITVKYPSSGLAYVNGAWRYCYQGKLNTSYSGLAKAPNGKLYYVKKGMLDKSFSGLTYYENAWYYVTNGEYNRSYTGLTYCSNEWWYIKNGTIDKSFAGLVYCNGAWWYVKNGTIDKGFVGLVYCNNTWWYVKNGTIDRSYTGLASANNAMWYVKNGKLDKTYSGKITFNKKTYTVKDGKVI